jgi:hypothetical protein
MNTPKSMFDGYEKDEWIYHYDLQDFVYIFAKDLEHISAVFKSEFKSSTWNSITIKSEAEIRKISTIEKLLYF